MNVRLKIGPEAALLVKNLANRRGLTLEEAVQVVWEFAGDDIVDALIRGATVAAFRDAADRIEGGRYDWGKYRGNRIQ